MNSSSRAIVLCEDEAMIGSMLHIFSKLPGSTSLQEPVFSSARFRKGCMKKCRVDMVNIKVRNSQVKIQLIVALY